MNPNIGLNDKHRSAVITLLAPLLADEMVLHTKTRNAHWNITGPHFHHLHGMFEEQYDALADTVDEVAERIRQMGGHAPGSMADFLRLARLKELKGRESGAQEFLKALLDDHEALVRQLRKDVAAADAKHGDAATADFLTGLMAAHEKTAWMLRASLKE